ACHGKVNLPANTSSRIVKTMCPKCGELLSVPPTPARHPEDERLDALHHAAAPRFDLRSQVAEVTGSSRSLGLVILGLGSIALLSVPLPFLVYAGLVLSGIGALMGLYGMVRGLMRRDRNVLYVLAGFATCGLGL